MIQADEEQPLLDSQRDTAEETIPAPQKPEKKVILNARRQAFLLEEVQACIAILQNLQIHATEKVSKTKNFAYGLTLVCSILIFGMFGEAGILLGLMFALSAMYNDRLAPGLKKQLDDIQKTLNPHKLLLKQQQTELTAAKNSYENSQDQYNVINDYTWALYREWANEEDGISPKEPNCSWWYNTDGTKDSILNYYKGGFNLTLSDEWCWMERHNITHPIAQCAEINNQLCELFLQEDVLKPQVDFSRAVYETAQTAVDATQAIVNSLQPKADHLKQELEHPDFHFETTPTTLFIICSITAICLLLGGGYACWRTHKNYRHERAVQAEDDVITAIKDPLLAERLINITQRFGINDLRNMTITTLITHLQTICQMLKDRRHQITMFLAGSLPRNEEATNKAFLDNDSQRDVTRKILGYASGRKN